ncbi:MAG: CARDB domain-containing protein, partial [bacterium]
MDVLQPETNAPGSKVKNNHLSNSLESGTVQDSIISPTTSPDNHTPANPMSPGPDLTYVLANCNMYYSYPNVTISVRIINQGDETAPPSTIGYYLKEYGGSGKEQIASLYIGAIDPGGYTDVPSTAYKISKHVGNWWVLFEIDELNSVSEDNEYNNVKTFSTAITVPLLIGSGPDLTYVPEFCTYSIIKDRSSGVNQLNIKSRIINIGNSIVLGKCKIGYYLSEDSHITTSDHSIDTDYLPPLNSGFYSYESIAADISDYVGTWWVGFIIDYDNSLPENNELNNIWTLGHSIKLLPNLSIIGVTVTDASGPKIGYQYSIQNSGYLSTGTGFKNYIYLSSDNTITSSDHKIDEQQFSALGSNTQTSSGAVQTRVRGVPAGKYYLGVYTDAEDVISESQENDNTYYDNTPRVTIPQPPASQPDLIVQEVTISDLSGPDIAYQYPVKNQGNASTEDGFTNHMYLSP